MIAKLIGKIDEINDNELIFNVNNICYRIVVSAILLNNPIVQSDAFLSIFIQQITREDGSTLYGFLTKEEKNIFNELIKINGLGPKFAMNLLSIMKPNEIYTAILNKDEARMTEASGIGKKLATRIIIEMQKVAEKTVMIEQFGSTRSVNVGVAAGIAMYVWSNRAKT